MKTKVVTRKKIFVVSLAHVFLLFVMTFAMLPASSQETPTLRLNPCVTEPPVAQGPGGTFTVCVDVDDVVDCMGYEFRLQWNPDVLQYVNYMPNPPMINPLPTIIRPGQADIAWMFPWGAFEGLTTDEPVPLGCFVFNVIGWGYSELDLKRTKLISICWDIEHEVLMGCYFINVSPVVEADFTAWKAKAQYQPNWDTSDYPTTMLRARVWNKGTVDVNVKVVFTISKGGFSMERHSNVVNLGPGVKATVYFDLAFGELDGTGKYDVSAQVSYWKIIESQPPTPNGATIKTFIIKANP